jgi:high-affinity iron transporter
VKATSGSTSQGKQNYMQGCYACHGEKGDGKGANSATLNPHPSSFTDQAAMAKIKDGELFWKITNGDGKGMPAYNSQYSDTERWNLVNYIRTFKAMHSPASAPAKPAAPATGKKPAAKKH